MLRHIVLLDLVDEATTGDVDAIVEALRRLPSHIRQIRSLTAAVDAGLAEGNARVLLEAEFDDVGAWEAYNADPAHHAVITDHIAPVLARKSAIQVELP